MPYTSTIFFDKLEKRYYRTECTAWIKGKKRYAIIEEIENKGHLYELGKPDNASRRCKQLNNPNLLF